MLAAVLSFSLRIFELFFSFHLLLKVRLRFREHRKPLLIPLPPPFIIGVNLGLSLGAGQ